MGYRNPPSTRAHAGLPFSRDFKTYLAIFKVFHPFLFRVSLNPAPFIFMERLVGLIQDNPKRPLVKSLQSPLCFVSLSASKCRTEKLIFAEGFNYR
ncbi:MAG TPA: hypothetical protein DCE03_02975 [Synergistaceae bacterium]|nr:hypothetical protein [Synergistaceae bacterium]